MSELYDTEPPDGQVIGLEEVGGALAGLVAVGIGVLWLTRRWLRVA